MLSMEYTWSDLEMIKKPFFFNLILYSTIGLGWIALFLDILSTWCKYKVSLDDETGFWGKTVLFEGQTFMKEVRRIETNL